MTLTKFMFHLLSVLALTLTITACSGGTAPTSPTADMPDSFGVAMGDRNIIAVYDAVIDPDAGTFTITPATDRTASFHFPLTNLYPNCVKVTGYGFTPNFWADIKISHPLPGSGINGYDPRVIAVIPANAGVSFNYPAFVIQGNNKVLMKPDGWTELFDALGGAIPGNVNPFICYMKTQPYRVWSSTGTTSETIRWNLKLTGFGGPIVYKLIVDVSTNYPAAPTPVVDNMKEPLVLSVNVGPGLTPTGGSATVEAILLDWQGTTGIMCQVESPSLFTGLINLAYDSPGPSADTYRYKGTISNSNLAPVGVYPVIVGGRDAQARIFNYLESSAEVKTAGETKVHSLTFTGIIPDDRWYDIGVGPDSYAYVCADHTATGNTDLARTALQFTNDLSSMVVLNPGVGMNDPDNWALYQTIWDRIDVMVNGKIVTNPMQGTIAIWTVSGSTATDDICCYRFICGYENVAQFADVWDHDTGGGILPDFAGLGYCDFGQTCNAPINENQGSLWLVDGATYGGGGMLSIYWTSGVPFYNYPDIKGIDGVYGTPNCIFLISGPNEGKLSLSGDWLSDSYSSGILPVEIQTTGAFGREDGNFYGGLDVTIDSKGNILTLEDHGGVFRFQKFDATMTWLWTSPWILSGSPMRMDYNKNGDKLYLLCDNGIHVCTVD